VKNASAFTCVALAMILGGCAPSADVSGWEMARKKPGDARLESFPEIPVVLPGAVPVAGATPANAGSQRGYLKQHDPGSLFRRGYTAPTP
jgi:hypothetical protein